MKKNISPLTTGLIIGAVLVVLGIWVLRSTQPALTADTTSSPLSGRIDLKTGTRQRTQTTAP